jgi:tetratricopeptide (TPR) repeat protein
MSRNLSFIIAFVLLLSGCTRLDFPQTHSIEGEDLMILEALHYHDSGETRKAIVLLQALHEKTQKPEYLQEALKIAFANELPMDSLLLSAKKSMPEDTEVTRIEVGMLLREGKFREAKELMTQLVKKEKSVKNLTVLGSIHFHLKEYELAFKYYDTIYKDELSEEALLVIVELLDVHLNRTSEAIAYLETHSRIKRCSKEICHKLIQIYGRTKNVDGLISTYKMLYTTHKEEQYAKKIAELLLFKQDFKGAAAFLETSNHDPLLLMDIYASERAYKKAFNVAQKAYEAQKKPRFLGLMAIYEYENYKEELTPSRLDSVAQKFEQIIAKTDDPLFLNYYGYLLIDHDLNIQKGIGLVKRALEAEPDSPYYIDSLAWGYYKLGECEKALEIIRPIMETVDEPEVKEHYDIITTCIKEKQ